MTRGSGGLLSLTRQRAFTFNLLPIYLGALPVLYFFYPKTEFSDKRVFSNLEFLLNLIEKPDSKFFRAACEN
jgi:hypothetical protein